MTRYAHDVIEASEVAEVAGNYSSAGAGAGADVRCRAARAK